MVEALLNITLGLEEFDEIFHIFCFDKSYESSILSDSHKSISLSYFKHISHVFWYDDLPLGSDSDRSMHLHADIHRWNLFFLSEHMYNKLEK